MTTTLQEIHTTLAHAIGKPVERSWIGGGSVFVIEQGDDMFLLDRNMWVLWLHNTAWQIEQAGQVIATSAEDHKTMQAGADVLDDKRLIQIEIDERSLNLTLHFENTIIVKTFTPSTFTFSPWLWYLPTGFVVTTDETNMLICRPNYTSTEKLL